MTTPVVNQVAAALASPYVQLPQFKTYPQWMDIDNLVPNNAIAGIQDAALADVLLLGSQDCVDFLGNMPLHAHLDTRQTRARTNRFGRLYIHPQHVPVRSVVALSYGPDPTTMIAFGLPSGSLWIEDGRQVSVTLSGQLFFTGPMIQFGNAPPPYLETFVNWTYVAGFVNTVLSASCTVNAAAISVADPTGILPGDLLRIWDDAAGRSAGLGSEAVYVSNTYVPAAPTWPPVATSIPLAANTVNAHGAGVGLGDMPRGIQQAVICYAISHLMRDDVSAEAPFAGTPFGPSIRRADNRGQAGGLVSEAERLLTRYAPTRWGN